MAKFWLPEGVILTLGLENIHQVNKDGDPEFNTMLYKVFRPLLACS
jgi:hypothetical protein